MPSGISGLAAGWYYGQVLSATTAQLSTATYTSGDPKLAVPVTFTNPSGITAGNYNQDTNAIIGVNFTLPGGSIGLNGNLSWDFIGSMAPTATNRFWSIRLGGSNIGGTSNFGNTTTGLRFRGRMHNRNSQSSQITSGFSGISTTTTAGGTYYLTINTSTDQTLDILLRIFDTVSNFFILESISIAVEYGG